MSDRLRDDPRVETLLYVIVVVVGASLIIVSSYQVESFTQGLLLNLGTDMTVVTIVFLIFKFFGRGMPPSMVAPLDNGVNYADINKQLAEIKDTLSTMKRETYHVDNAITEKLVDTTTKIALSYTYAKLEKIPERSIDAGKSNRQDAEASEP